MQKMRIECRALRLLLIGILVTVGAGNQLAAQNRLSDVAGKIKLKKPEGEDAVISNQNLESGGALAQPRDSTYLGCLDWKTEVLGDELEELQVLTSSSDVSDPRWISTFRMQCDVIVEVSDSFAACRPDALSNSNDHNQLIAAVSNCRAAAVAAKTWNGGANLERAQYTRGLLVRVIPELNAAKAKIAAKAASQPAPPSTTSLMAHYEIEETCTQNSSGDEYLKQLCIRLEKEAYETLNSRSSSSTRLPIGTFNAFRAACAAESPKSYVGRDACEQRVIRRYFNE